MRTSAQISDPMVVSFMLVVLGIMLKTDDTDHKTGWVFSSKRGLYSAWPFPSERKVS